MLELIDVAIDCMPGDTPRDCVFEICRPNCEHIKPPQGMDLTAHLDIANKSEDFEWEWESDSDDDEGVAPSGRISPCTFLEWSRGSVRWGGVEEPEMKPVR